MSVNKNYSKESYLHDSNCNLSYSNSILIRKDMDALLHQIGYLKRSQIDLAQALTETPGDEDFATAYEENKTVIENKVIKLSELKSQLLQIDPAFRLEHSRLAAISDIWNEYRNGNRSQVETTDNCNYSDAILIAGTETNEDRTITENEGLYL